MPEVLAGTRSAGDRRPEKADPGGYIQRRHTLTNEWKQHGTRPAKVRRNIKKHLKRLCGFNIPGFLPKKKPKESGVLQTTIRKERPGSFTFELGLQNPGEDPWTHDELKQLGIYSKPQELNAYLQETGYRDFNAALRRLNPHRMDSSRLADWFEQGRCLIHFGEARSGKKFHPKTGRRALVITGHDGDFTFWACVTAKERQG